MEDLNKGFLLWWCCDTCIPVLQEWIQEIPTPSGRSGSHSTQNDPNFPQGLLPWWHRWGKWGRRKFFSVRTAVNFLIKILEEANICSDSEKFSLSRSLWAKALQGKSTLVYSFCSRVIGIRVFQDMGVLLVFTGGFTIWLQKEGSWMGTSIHT